MVVYACTVPSTVPNSGGERGDMYRKGVYIRNFLQGQGGYLTQMTV